MSGQPVVVLPGGDVVIPAALCPQLAEALRLFSDECRGVRRPSAAPRPRMTRDLAAIDEAVRVAAQAYTVRPALVAASWVNVAGAARLLGVTASAVRQLLASGGLDGVKVDGRWRVDQSSIGRRSAHGGRSSGAAGVRSRGRG